MKHPPYHLRVNKAVDRFILVETIKELSNAGFSPLCDYTYHSLGGPFLEDFRLIHQHFPEIQLISVEKSPETFKRQKFHKFCKQIRLVESPLDRYLDHDFTPGKRDILWLDFTDLRASYFNWIASLLPRLGNGSLVRVTFPVSPPLHPSTLIFVPIKDRAGEESKRTEKFDSRYSAFLPTGWNEMLSNDYKFSNLITRMLNRLCEEAALSNSLEARILSAHRYADGQAMMTASIGVIEPEAFNRLGSYPDLSISEDGSIATSLLDLPLLSVKERMKLDPHLPQTTPTGTRLANVLGYLIDANRDQSIEALKQYCKYYRYYPLFGRIDL